MNLRQTIVFALSFTVLASCGGAGSENPETEVAIGQPTTGLAVTSGKYKIKSGIVEFDVEAMGSKQKKVLYFDDFGSKERVENYNADGTVREVSISDGKKRHTLYPSEKSAFFVDENGDRGWEMEFVTWDRLQGREEYSKAPDMTIVGRDCASFKYGEKNTFAGWNGVLLYHEQTPLFKATAVSLEENAAIEGNKFTVPADYTITNI